mmetsp:Transcript_9371/g.15286  ORF Transcript_9371/g.15286 Transcript_9371/m.15286 type:complete len:521 (+) Transcript_9371:1762-3324(+)
MPRPTESASAHSASASPEEIQEMVAHLRYNFETDKTRSKAWRLAQLNGLNKMLTEGRDELCQGLFDDLHRSKFEGYMQEIALCQQEIYDAIQHLDEWMADEYVGTGLFNAPAQSMVQKDPLGVVLVLGAWNYNILLTLQPLIGAVAAGNCVIVKPGSYAENTGNVMCQLIQKYLDQDCIRAVMGNRHVTNALLDEYFDKIFFTGSPFVGQVVAEKAAKHLTPVILELGGKSPVIIDKTANLEIAAKRSAWAACMNSAQTCVRPDYFLVHEDVADKFIKEFKETLLGFYGKDVKSSEWFGRIINDSAFQRLIKCRDDAERYIVHGGESDASEKFIEPTLFDFGTDLDAFENSELMKDEIFGPLIPIYRYKDLETEVLPFIRERPKPLALYCFTTDEEISERVLRLTSSGGAIINDAVIHLANPELPFGGVGASGMGSYHGKRTFDAFTHQKAVIKRLNILDQSTRYPPYTPQKQFVMNLAFTPQISYYYNRLAHVLTDKKNVALALMSAYIFRNATKQSKL